MMKKIIYVVVAILGIGFILIISLEMTVRLIEARDVVIQGTMGWEKDKVLGWVPIPGKGTVLTREYRAEYDVNINNMNDRPIESDAKQAKVRILVLGDSHTFAVGVSQNESWPKVLEILLFSHDAQRGMVYNCAVTGYSLGQYLLRMRQMEKMLKPHIVIIGFSMATDLYDLIPPRLGGFVYGGNFGRVYFDLDENGKLIELHDLEGQDIILTHHRKPIVITLRNLIGQSAFYNRFKRSKLAMWLALRFKIKGRSWWGYYDVAVKKNLNKEEKYLWRLTEEIIKEMGLECRANNVKIVVVNIPYLPQIYDSIWSCSYGQCPEEYDRFIGGIRLGKICKEAGVFYIDTTKVFIEKSRRSAVMFHFKRDGHPTAEGHRIIAYAVYDGLSKLGLMQ